MAAASGAAYSPCTSPTKQPARLSLAQAAPLGSVAVTSPVRLTLPNKQHHRRLCVSVSASGSPTPSASSPCSSAGGQFSPHGSPASAAAAVQPLLLHCPSPPAFHAPPRPHQGYASVTRFGNSSSSSMLCRNAPQGGSVGPTSNGDSADFDSSSLGRAMSPISTAEQPVLSAFDSSSSSSVTEAGGLDSSPEQPLQGSAAAAAVALPRVASRGAMALSATAAAAAAAEAAVAGVLDATTGQVLAAPEAVTDAEAAAAAAAGVSAAAAAAAGDLQDIFTLLKLQVASGLPPAQLAATLVPIVRSAAANQLSLPFITTGGRHLLLVQLMGSEDAAVAVLAAEAWCRVCGDADLEPWAEALLPAVPVLLSLIGSNASPEGRAVPLLFFAVSSLVRMATLPAVAAAVRQRGGLPLLVMALDVVPAAICQVTTFALFRLMREVDGDLSDEQLSNWQPVHEQQEQEQEMEQGQQQAELALVTYVRAGVFSKLCKVLALVEQGSAHELAFSMMLSLSLIPAAQQLVADQGEVQELVQVMANPPSSAVRLETMLVLGRLAARNRACQQDAVREGVVPVLVSMMSSGSEEERCHACRLLAILGQHETTHQLIADSGAVPVMLQLLRNHGLLVVPDLESAQHTAAAQQEQQHAEPWHEVPEDPVLAAQLESSNSSANAGSASSSSVRVADSADADADSDAAGDAAEDGADADADEAATASSSDGDSDRYHTSGPFKAAKRPQPAAAAAAAAGSNSAIGPGLVLEQAAGLACMLCHNADNHFTLVNQGIVPLLVALLQQGTAPKTVTYTMASLLMLCMGDSRNAAVVARVGAIPALVSIAREGSNRPANRELASALLAVMCRSQAAQVDVVASGGIPALTRLLAEGTAGACCSAAEALTQIATTSDVRCRLIVRAGALPHLIPMLQPGSGSMSLLWAARLLKALAQERNTLWEVCETPGLLSLLPDILNRRTGQPHREQQLILEFRAAAAAAAAAASAPADATGTGSSGDELSSLPGAAAAAAAGGRQQEQQQDGLAEEQGSQEGSAAAGDEHDAESLAKAQAHIAWLLAALASDTRSRDIMSELSSFLVRPLVMLLRDSQEGAGPGYTLHDVLHGMANNRQAAASAALRALGKHVRIAGLIQSEIALQHWMGRNVQLPDATPAPTPGWFLNIDMWSPDGHSEDDKAAWP